VCTETGVARLWVAYNSLGAGASVNHRHFQSFVADALPLAHARWAHHGGDTVYPLPCEVYRDAEAAWQRLAALQAANQPFNLIYGRDLLYVIPRRAQDDAGLDADTRGWGWSEMAGGLTVFRRDAYTAMTAARFAQALSRFAP
jgi:ATP adenylyltransferase/5',5'''-P-1,P-4-tetraphosphate phosphorylase II